MTPPLTNWAANYTYTAPQIHRPHTVEEVQQIVASADHIRPLGTRHSFNAIADSQGALLSLEHFNHILSLDPANKTVTVEAGVRYGELGQYLHGQGFAVHNLASLPHISVAGAVATATHGSGQGNGNLATAVSALELVTASGEVVTVSRAEHGNQFNGMVVALGALGVVTKVTLDIVPTFNVQQSVYQNLPMAQLAEHLDEVLGQAYSVSLFTDWKTDSITQVWVKQRVDEATTPPMPTLFGAALATQNLHPLIDLSPVNCTEQLGIPGPWHERLPHFRLDFTPSSGEELQSEYFVPRANAWAALQAIYALRQHIAPLLLISEVRTIAADALWMSMCYQQDSLAIHFTWKKDWANVRAVLPLIEQALAPFGARPHWGKLFTLRAAQLQPRYTRLPDFQKLAHEYDPQGKFRNAFLEESILGV